MGRKIPIILGLALLLLVVIVENVSAVSNDCPVSSQMTMCSPTCKDDSQCFGRKCCPNICNTRSCVAANQKGGSSTGYKGSSSSATGVYCGNVKCNSFEKCELERGTKRMKCVRA